MAVGRAAGGSSLIDVLDRVLDKGIVIDAWLRVSLVGIDLVTVEARIVVASIDTYLKYSDAIGAAASASRPTFESPRDSILDESLRFVLQNDDDDNGEGGGGSSGAPATLRVGIQPRRRPP